ncbi:hypothetical protein FOIG_16781 [Fusarium odoratissimum NRRL 54006]|uniref:Uncharacterized protein n=1 Tax=Fusarium odoratissimum (strain NRRL 54006) TaxID=1089451 RepID=X0J0P8_FUSO5|nr:uncharacterized protein FOIG_16781 [Fusarium odoratissimum NRRL 54006]EXL89936.1 hypothetical protein FOIG_16781 [Fusarium odoratissimum NRRL 54006]
MTRRSAATTITWPFWSSPVPPRLTQVSTPMCPGFSTTPTLSSSKPRFTPRGSPC